MLWPLPIIVEGERVEGDQVWQQNYYSKQLFVVLGPVELMQQ